MGIFKCCQATQRHARQRVSHLSEAYTYTARFSMVGCYTQYQRGLEGACAEHPTCEWLEKVLDLLPSPSAAERVDSHCRKTGADQNQSARLRAALFQTMHAMRLFRSVSAFRISLPLGYAEPLYSQWPRQEVFGCPWDLKVTRQHPCLGGCNRQTA